ncbi:hypothetical protein L218DRAFT_1002240 [Marasmius fiardii PR-910]|nr:hypothetical protein L218DRAFT_1002240 [Marasmius fiardii PR-910]
MQLFGYNQSEAFPALIFSDDVLPLGYVLEHYQSAPLLLHMISKVHAFQIELHQNPNRALHVYMNTIWVHSDGKLSHGIPGHQAALKGYWTSSRDTLKSLKHHTALPIKNFSNTNLLWKGIIDSFPGLPFLMCCHWEWRRDWYLHGFRSEGRNLSGPSEPHTAVFSPVDGPEERYKFGKHSKLRPNHRHVLATLPFDGYSMESFKIDKLTHTSSKINMTKMEDESIHIPSKSLEYFSSNTIQITFKLNNEELASITWLSQSCSIFEKLCIPRSEWPKYGITPRIDFFPEFQHKKHIPSDSRPYTIFLRPSMSDGQPISSSWIFNSKPYCQWSQDPTGKSIIPPAEQKALGLPYVAVWELHACCIWSEEAYDCIRKYQELNGFDPSTTDFARSLGLPILEVITHVDEVDPMDGFGLDFVVMESSMTTNETDQSELKEGYNTTGFGENVTEPEATSWWEMSGGFYFV